MKSRHTAPIGLATAVACALTSCGSAAQDPLGAAHDRPGCSWSVEPIVEPTDFAPWEGRIGAPMIKSKVRLTPYSSESAAPLPLGLPDVLGGRTATASENEYGHVTVVFGGPRTTPRTRSTEYADAVVLNVSPGGSGDLAQALKNDPDGGYRVNLVPVGPFDAAVTWADPDAKGIRWHNVIWTDPARGGDFKLEALMGPEELVRLARELVCGR